MFTILCLGVSCLLVFSNRTALDDTVCIYVYVLGIMKQVFARLRNVLSGNKFLRTVIPLVLGGVCIGSPLTVAFCIVLCVIAISLFTGAVNYALPLTVGNGNLQFTALVKFGGIQGDLSQVAVDILSTIFIYIHTYIHAYRYTHALSFFLLIEFAYLFRLCSRVQLFRFNECRLHRGIHFPAHFHRGHRRREDISNFAVFFPFIMSTALLLLQELFAI